jgi:hypothetical protein
MFSFFSWLFDASPYMPRYRCGDWPEWLVDLARWSDISIGLAYVGISCSLLWLWHRRRRDIHAPHILVMFFLFIILCGWTHFNDALAFTWPAYRFAALVKALTATASAATLAALPAVVRYAARMPTREQKHELDNELSAKNLQLTEANLLLTDAYEELSATHRALSEHVAELKAKSGNGGASGPELDIVLLDLKLKLEGIGKS